MASPSVPQPSRYRLLSESALANSGRKICHKCQKRGRSAQCYYHPAPLSRSREHRAADRHALTSPSQSSSTEPAISPITPITPNTPVRCLIHHSRAPNATSGWRMWRTAPDSSGLKCYAADANIFNHLLPFEIFEKILPSYFEISNTMAIPAPFVLRAMSCVKLQIESLSEGDGSFQRLFDEVSQNTTRPFEVPNDIRPADFHKLFTGENLRWECIGLATLVLSPTHTAFVLPDATHLDEGQFLVDMIIASNTCISLCRQCASENEVLLWLLLVNALLISNYYGDTSQALWRRLGDLVSDMFSMGLHRNPEEPTNRPFFLVEIHKRIFAALYRADKSLATFLCRPPRVPRHYCDIRLPLDLADEDLMLEGQDLDLALSRLDSKGWNTDKVMRRSSFIRIRYSLSVYREEILELINQPWTDQVHQRLNLILDELPKTWAEVPEHLRYEDRCWEREPRSNVCLTLLACFLDHLHSEFLIQRHLSRKTQTSRQDLIKTSMHILTTVLAVVRKRNIIADEHHLIRDFPWFLCYYGLPPAGVLATELRACTLANTPLEPSISRSQLIRDLSVLINSLGWIDKPNHRYYKLCNEANEVLGNILDEALNYQPKSNLAELTPQTDPSQQYMNTTMIDANFPMDSENFLAWLDSVDWNSTVPSF